MIDYTGPVVTADVIVVRCHESLDVLTLRRDRDPFAGQSALPGVYVNRGETVAEAVDRCLKAKCGVSVPATAYRSVVGVHDAVGRDPRGHALSVVTVAVVGPEQPTGTGAWMPVEDLSGSGETLAFDHDRMVVEMRTWLTARLWEEPAIVEALLGSRRPTTANFVGLQTAVIGGDVDPSNLRRRIVAAGHYAPTNERVPQGGRGSPSTVWQRIG